MCDGLELHRPSIKGTKLLLKVIKAVIIMRDVGGLGYGLVLLYSILFISVPWVQSLGQLAGEWVPLIVAP